MKFGSVEVQENVALAPLTTYHVGGVARYYWELKERQDLLPVLAEARAQQLPVFVLGGGSNVLFADAGFPGLVIKQAMTAYEIRDHHLWLEGGVSWHRCLEYCLTNGLAGLEKMAGIPGTVGGAVRGNAGVFDCTVGQAVEEVTVLTPDGLQTWGPADMAFAYRSSAVKTRGGIILDVLLRLSPGDQAQLAATMNEMIKMRREKHPAGFSCGSFFKNPAIQLSKALPEWKDKFYTEGDYLKVPAGFLIEQVGAKGWREGGAVVSLKHSNFLINEGTATAADITRLAERLVAAVETEFGITLEPEVEYAP